MAVEYFELAKKNLGRCSNHISELGYLKFRREKVWFFVYSTVHGSLKLHPDSVIIHYLYGRGKD